MNMETRRGKWIGMALSLTAGLTMMACETYDGTLDEELAQEDEAFILGNFRGPQQVLETWCDLDVTLDCTFDSVVITVENLGNTSTAPYNTLDDVLLWVEIHGEDHFIFMEDFAAGEVEEVVLPKPNGDVWVYTWVDPWQSRISERNEDNNTDWGWCAMDVYAP